MTRVRRLFYLGTDDDTEPSEQRYIVLVNSVAMFGVVVSVFYLAINLALQGDFWLQLMPSAATAVVYTVPLFLNHRRRYWAATTFLVAAALMSHLGFSIAFGHASGSYFYFLPVICGIPLIYPARHSRTAMVFLLTGLAVFVGFVLFGERLAPLADPGPETSEWYHVLALVTVAVAIGFVSSFAHRRVVIADAMAAERSRELEAALAELKASQAKMIEAESQAMLGRVVAGLLHEVNSPLGAMRSDAHTLVAVKAIEGRGLIRVSIAIREEWVHVELADDGKGIPPERMGTIFELGLNRKGNRMGMGLGLPMSKRSIEDMGGRLVVESSEGKGTTARILLPAVREN